MARARFVHYEHRTTDPVAARTFYEDVLGARLLEADVSVTSLPEHLTARGVPPHWVGHLGVADVEATLAQIRAAGGEPVGPLHRHPDGSLHAFFRDPLGAVVAVSSGQATAADPVAWRMLHTRDPDPALAWYTSLFGWLPADHPGFGSGHRPFAWEAAGPAVGSVTDLAAQPTIHIQWLFCFPVPDGEAAAARVRARGGHALPIARSGTGDLFIVCDDPLGGAFCLHQRAAPG
jgi:predicted enzyme related to lactoylglutathione lyase